MLFLWEQLDPSSQAVNVAHFPFASGSALLRLPYLRSKQGKHQQEHNKPEQCPKLVVAAEFEQAVVQSHPILFIQYL